MLERKEVMPHLDDVETNQHHLKSPFSGMIVRSNRLSGMAPRMTKDLLSSTASLTSAMAAEISLKEFSAFVWSESRHVEIVSN